MRKLIKYLFQLLFIFIALTSIAQEITVSAKIDTNTILIGDQIKLKYTVNTPLSYQVQFPIFNDKLSDKIEIVGQSNIDSVINKEKSILSLSKTLTITSFDSGAYVIPSIQILLKRNNDTTIYQIISDSLLLNVNSIAVDTTLAIKDIKSPMEAPLTFKELLPFILVGLGIIALIILIIYFVYRFRNKKKNQSEPSKPKIPPYKTALKDFEALRQKKLWQNDKIKEYHSELTDILRNYFEQQLNIQALEKTSDETLEAFESVISDQDLSKKLSAILTLADLVKFAKQLPLPDQHDLSLQYAIEIVKETSINMKNESNAENIEKLNDK